MNIFALDLDPELCAKYHCDKHLVKMITEHNQILCSVAHFTRGATSKKQITAEYCAKHFSSFPRSTPYGIGHQNHPCTVWARQSMENYVWLCRLTKCMCHEYTRRYLRQHLGERVCAWCTENAPSLPAIGLTPFYQAMPEDCRGADAIESYRYYYCRYKAYFAKWKYSEKPFWFRGLQTDRAAYN